MELGEVYSLFPTFWEFARMVSEYPHVAPHTFVCGLEGYAQALGPYIFYISERVKDPQCLLWEKMYEFSQFLEKWCYPAWGRRTKFYLASQRRYLTEWVREELEKWLLYTQDFFGERRRNELFCFLGPVADRLVSLLARNVPPMSERKSLRDIPPYVTMSNRAAQYISTTTHLEVSPIPEIVNTIQEKALHVRDVGYPRVPRMSESVSYAEIDRPRVIEV